MNGKLFSTSTFDFDEARPPISHVFDVNFGVDCVRSRGERCEFSRTMDSKDFMKIFATTGESGDPMAAPDISLKNLPWKTN
ncbi:hypothetical protein Trydic_g5883 [Trypoxylus dichotomus]